MNNEYYGAPSTPNDDFLAHYGIKGMKWGVRKALKSGNSRALGRQYAKAQRKLAKLEKRANNGKKYAKRAAALGVGAAAAGGLAAVGTSGVGRGLNLIGSYGKQGMRGIGGAMSKVGTEMTNRGIRGGGRLAAAGEAVSKAAKPMQKGMSNAATAVHKWGTQRSIGQAVGNTVGNTKVSDSVNKFLVKNTGTNVPGYGEKLKRMSNNTYARIGAAGIGAGLAGAAGYNAYRAATTKRAAKKAAQFRSEMNKAFAGTQYANGRPASQKKRRRR